MKQFKSVEERSRKAQEAYFNIMLKAVSTIYTGCILLMLSLPATLFIKSYLAEESKKIKIDTLFENITPLLIALACILVLAVIGWLFEQRALNFIDEYSEKDKKEADKAKLKRN